MMIQWESNLMNSNQRSSSNLPLKVRYLDIDHEDRENQSLRPSVRRVPWKRILYEKQPQYKDNYYDPKTFFSQLSISRPWYVQKLSSAPTLPLKLKLLFTYYSQLVFHSTMIMQQFSAISFFLCIHKYLLHHYISFVEVATLNISFLVVGIGLYYLFEIPARKAKFSLIGFLKTIILFIMSLKMTSPIIKTLTSSVSEDTIQALTIFLAVIHLVFHDYQQISDTNSSSPALSKRKEAMSVSMQHHSLGKGVSAKNLGSSGTETTLQVNSLPYDIEEDKNLSSRVLSLNTAIFTAILLASRLDDSNTVVAYVILALISFFLFPVMVSLIKQRSSILFISFAIFQWLSTSYLIYRLDWTLFIAYEVLVSILWFIGPLLFLLLLPYKKAYHGPWDVAEIR